LVDPASLPPQLRRTADDEIKRLRAGDGVLYGQAWMMRMADAID
jgi:hypothetical protein